MTASLLLLLIGMTDVARAARSARAAVIRTALVWAVIAVLAVGLGIRWGAVVVCVLLALAWMFAVPVPDQREPRQVWPAVLLVLILASLILLETPHDPRESGLGRLYSSTRLAAADISLATSFATLGVVAFLTLSGNVVVRAALGRAHTVEVLASLGDRRVPPVTERTSWRVRIRRRVRNSVGGPARVAATLPPDALRGGRWIGPLERLLIVLAAVGGAEAIVAALLAAKGIVRFPEIAKDSKTGRKAEEFLVGSLVSWAIAAGAVAYLHLVASAA